MARVAFFMDQLLRKIGLSGRSIVPMLIGFGCSVPAIMSTRTLASERDRRMTILLTPFMSCSAKIPIYGVFSAAFFPDCAALVMIMLYLGGILVGILAAKVLGKTAFRGNPSLCHGASQLPLPLCPECGAAVLGQGQGLSDPRLYDHLYRHHCRVVSADF